MTRNAGVLADLAIGAYIVCALCYTAAATAYFVTLGMRTSALEQVAVLFSIVFAIYVFASVLIACWLYRDLVNQRAGQDSIGWLLGFVLVGGIASPIYYFAHRQDIQRATVPMNSPLFDRLTQALVSVLVVVSCVRMGWVLAIALSHGKITHGYLVAAAIDRWVTRASLLVIIVFLARRPWPLARQIAWAIASLFGMFLIMPILATAHTEPTRQTTDA